MAPATVAAARPDGAIRPAARRNKRRFRCPRPSPNASCLARIVGSRPGKLSDLSWSCGWDGTSMQTDIAIPIDGSAGGPARPDGPDRDGRCRASAGRVRGSRGCPRAAGAGQAGRRASAPQPLWRTEGAGAVQGCLRRARASHRPRSAAPWRMVQPRHRLPGAAALRRRGRVVRERPALEAGPSPCLVREWASPCGAAACRSRP